MNGVDSFTTGNITWKVRVEAKSFWATAPGFTEVSGLTWEAMEDRARSAYAKSKITVDMPYVYLDWQGPEDDRRPVFRLRHATGIHGRNGNVLYTQNGAPGQETGSTSAAFMRPMAADDAEVFLEIVAQMASLDHERAFLVRKYAFKSGLREAVQNEINAEHARRRQEDAMTERAIQQYGPALAELKESEE